MKENLKYAFIWAAEYGDVPLFITLYSRGAENLPDHNGYTALMAAARKGHTDIVKMLLSLPGHQLDTTDDYDKNRFGLCQRKRACRDCRNVAGGEAKE